MFRRRVAGEGEEERSVRLTLREGGAVRQRGRDERELEVAGLCLLRSKEVCSNDNSSARGGVVWHVGPGSAQWWRRLHALSKVCHRDHQAAACHQSTAQPCQGAREREYQLGTGRQNLTDHL